MTIDIQEVNSYSDRKAFVDFQFNLYKDSKFWVPPMRKDEIDAINSKTNPAFEFCKASYWIAYQNGKIVGRIGAIINHLYNEKVNEKLGRINRVEFIDSDEVVNKLFGTAIEWLKKEGVTRVHGPLGFTNLDTQGLLIEGFDHLPSIASVYHLPYYQTHFERLGFTKENDWVEFRLTLTEHPVHKASRGAELIKRRFGFEVVRFQNKSEMMAYTPQIFEILNSAFQSLPYVQHFNSKMVEYYTKKYFNVLDPIYVRAVKKDDQLVGFVVGLPNLSKAMQKANGRLWPFGFWYLFQALKRPTEIDLLLTGVLLERQHEGVAVILFAELQSEMLSQGIHIMETTGIFEDNHNVISNWKNYENVQHKRRRCYTKNI